MLNVLIELGSLAIVLQHLFLDGLTFALFRHCDYQFLAVPSKGFRSHWTSLAFRSLIIWISEGGTRSWEGVRCRELFGAQETTRGLGGPSGRKIKNPNTSSPTVVRHLPA